MLQDFNWQVNDGEHWVISGANGSGKTVLLELLAGANHAAQGEVDYSFVSGADWDERFAMRKKAIHYIPAHAIQIFLSHHELFYQQRYYSIGDERVPQVKDIFGDDLARLDSLDFPPNFNITSLMNLAITRLSNGQLKKVLILKNLVQEIPNVLLFDYPFEGLDVDSCAELTTFMDHLSHRYHVQLIVVDNGQHLPSVINKRMVLNDFKFSSIEDVRYSIHESNPREHISFPQPSSETVFEMKDVTIRYGEHEIISKFNWTVCKGERWALTGKNGSGKTTLFSLIFADHPMAYSEKIFLFGKRRGTGESIWDIKKRITYLGPELISYLNPQHISATARDTIIIRKKNARKGDLEKLVEYFEAGSFFDNPVRTLSSGQLQLMLIVESFLSDKELLLLDEPFQFLDPATKERVTAYLQSHLHPDTTLIMITHYEEDIAHWTEKRMRL